MAPLSPGRKPVGGRVSACGRWVYKGYATATCARSGKAKRGVRPKLPSGSQESRIAKHVPGEEGKHVPYTHAPPPIMHECTHIHTAYHIYDMNIHRSHTQSHPHTYTMSEHITHTHRHAVCPAVICLQLFVLYEK